MDCNKTIDFFAEAKRLCDSRTACRADAANKERCPLIAFCWNTFATRSAEESITAFENLQKWSDEHPKETYAQDFMKIVLEKGAYKPEKAHPDDAGFDLMARERQIVPAQGSAIFDIGVHIEIPQGFVGFLKSKSGLNVKHGITSEGVIDAGYTGNICVKLHNNTRIPYLVEKGDKISQLVILPIYSDELEVVDSLNETARGNSGFGSSGR